ncbi:hypothetical protein BDZ89DRAFT_1064863 [Hymenopellis radicata]|nr:hypothetical protein BDZ89DRAFT_1064863 [Hymenopellis radicata]
MSGPPNCWLRTALPPIDSSTSRHHPRICPALVHWSRHHKLVAVAIAMPPVPHHRCLTQHFPSHVHGSSTRLLATSMAHQRVCYLPYVVHRHTATPLLTRCLSCTHDPSTNVDHILPCPSCGRPSAVPLLALSSGLRQFASFGLLSSVQFDRRRPTIEDGSTRS